MRLVVDASVAVKWLLEEEYSADARRLLEQGHELYAPRLLASEIGNSLWKNVRTGNWSEAGPVHWRLPFQICLCGGQRM